MWEEEGSRVGVEVGVGVGREGEAMELRKGEK